MCHSQCVSNYSCWGPNDTQCDGCKHFAYNRRCVEQCSDITQPPGSSGIYQNARTGVCEDCDPQCLGGCANGMVRTASAATVTYTFWIRFFPLSIPFLASATNTVACVCHLLLLHNFALLQPTYRIHTIATAAENSH